MYIYVGRYFFTAQTSCCDVNTVVSTRAAMYGVTASLGKYRSTVLPYSLYVRESKMKSSILVLHLQHWKREARGGVLIIFMS